MLPFAGAGVPVVLLEIQLYIRVLLYSIFLPVTFHEYTIPKSRNLGALAFKFKTLIKKETMTDYPIFSEHERSRTLYRTNNDNAQHQLMHAISMSRHPARSLQLRAKSQGLY